MEEDSEKSYDKPNKQWSYGDQDSSHSDNSQRHTDKTENLSINLADLHKAKDRFKQFLNEIGDLRKTSIREDILHYCGSQKKSQKSIEAFYRPEALIKKIQIRIEKMLKTKKIKRNWGEQDLKILIWVISKYSDVKGFKDLQKDITNQDWKMIASVIPGVTAEACMFKWLSIKKITLATHNWTSQQSHILGNIVHDRLEKQDSSGAEIKDWKQISQQLYKLNTDNHKVYRNAKQCREHWTCYLSPQLKKGPWQLYEDVKLLKFIKENKGLKKWSQIAKHFQGRTQNALKNRYTLIIDKQKKQPKNKGKQQLDLISEYLQKCYVDQFTASVKIQDGSIYQQQSIQQGYNQQQGSQHCCKQQNKKQEYHNHDTTESVITPVRVERVRFGDLQSMNIHFFKNMQPGVMSDGTFRKMFSKESAHHELKEDDGPISKKGESQLTDQGKKE